jgi:cystathionine beta-lyase
MARITTDGPRGEITGDDSYRHRFPSNETKAPRPDIMTNETTIGLELSHSALRARRNAKWNQHDADVIPAWIADMDFAVAAPIQATIERTVRDGD